MFLSLIHKNQDIMEASIDNQLVNKYVLNFYIWDQDKSILLTTSLRISVINFYQENILIDLFGDFPCGLVVKTPRFHFRVLVPGWGAKILHAMVCSQKKKKSFGVNDDNNNNPSCSTSCKPGTAVSYVH